MLASIIVLHVASAEVDTAVTTAIARAIERAMDAAAAVSVRPAPGAPPRPVLAATCGEAGVSGTAVVSWSAPDRREFTVQVRQCATGDESNFHLAFAPGDPPAERARSVGFVIASALHASAQPPAAAAPALEAPPTAALPAPVPSAAPIAEAAAPPSPSVITRDDVVTAPSPPRVMTGRTLDAFLLVGVPLGGDGGGIGGGLAGRLGGPTGWGTRLGLQARSGQIGAAQASLFEAGLAAGVTYTLRPPGAGLAPAVGLRLDVSLLYESLTHFSDDDPQPVRHQRFFPAAGGLLELTWPFGPVDLQLGAGVQAATAVADVVVRGNKVAKLPAWRATAEFGFRVGF